MTPARHRVVLAAGRDLRWRWRDSAKPPRLAPDVWRNTAGFWDTVLIG